MGSGIRYPSEFRRKPEFEKCVPMSKAQGESRLIPISKDKRMSDISLAWFLKNFKMEPTVDPLPSAKADDP